VGEACERAGANKNRVWVGVGRGGGVGCGVWGEGLRVDAQVGVLNDHRPLTASVTMAPRTPTWMVCRRVVGANKDPPTAIKARMSFMTIADKRCQRRVCGGGVCVCVRVLG
jgi:hypothetical protein